MGRLRFEASRTARLECAEAGEGAEPLDLWAVRIYLSSGETSVLISSLNPELFDVDFFGELYALRWGDEEEIKHPKGAAQVENFSGKSVEAVLQDFHARVFLVNLTAILALPVHEEIKQRTWGAKIRISD